MLAGLSVTCTFEAIAPLTPRAEWPEVKDFAHRLALAVTQSDLANGRYWQTWRKGRRTPSIVASSRLTDEARSGRLYRSAEA